MSVRRTSRSSLGFGAPEDHRDDWYGQLLAAGGDGVWWVADYSSVYEVVDGRVARTLDTPTDVLQLRVAGQRVLAAPHLIDRRTAAVILQPPLWNKASMRVIPEQTEVKLAAWSTTGERLAVLGELQPGRGKHRARRPSGPEIQLWLLDGVARQHPRMVWSGEADKYTTLRFEPSALVLAGSELRVFDGEGRLEHELTPPADIADGCFTADGRWFVAALDSGELGIWATKTWAETVTATTRDVPWLSVVAHPRHAIVVAGADDGTLAAFDIRTTELLATTQLDPPSAIHALAISERGDRLLLSTPGQMWSLSLRI